MKSSKVKNIPQLFGSKNRLLLMLLSAIFISLSCAKNTNMAISSATDDTDKALIEKGKGIAAKTQLLLGNNLKSAIGQHGSDGAVSFCNEKAIPLTDSAAALYKTAIKRVSDKPRNPKNKASQIEIDFINKQKESLSQGLSPAAGLVKIKNKYVAYYPITTNTMCLQCHGEIGKDIQEKTSSTIISKYPKDKATGYKSNEIRGLWAISFTNN